jgi:hypothetical protein
MLMDWLEITSLLGNLGEFIGSLAVMVTLIILVVQVRQSARAVEESNRLQRAATIDRHADSISNWRSLIAGDEALASIWQRAREDQPLDPVERLRLNFVFINFLNTQRSNFHRANTVGEAGLARQSVLAVVSEVVLSKILREEWRAVTEWVRLVSPEYVIEVEAALADHAAGRNRQYAVGGLKDSLAAD